MPCEAAHLYAFLGNEVPVPIGTLIVPVPVGKPIVPVGLPIVPVGRPTLGAPVGRPRVGTPVGRPMDGKLKAGNEKSAGSEKAGRSSWRFA